MRTAKITLAGQEWTIQERPTRKNEEWRQSLEAELAPVVDVLQSVSREEITVDNAHHLAPQVQRVVEIALASPEKVRDLVIAYSPQLAENRDRLLDEAYDSEFVEAFTKLIGLAYPFGEILPAIQRLSAIGESAPAENGQETPAISQSLP